MNNKKITILGAGVIGLSSALTAAYCGWNVEILTEKKFSDADAKDKENYNFSSLYAAASILLHSIAKGDNIDALMDCSDLIFEKLAKNKKTGIRHQNHLEMYDVDNCKLAKPHYLKSLRNVKSLNHLTKDASIIQRNKNVPVEGYSFDVWFADMPSYSIWLENRVREQNIKFTEQTLTSSNVQALIKNSAVVINCLGAESINVFPGALDTGFYIEGSLLHYPNPETGPLFNQKTNNFLSWNYTPLPEIYSMNGERSDVYFYPRYNDFILGGTRRVGQINKKTGEVTWENLDLEMCEVEGGTIPKAIIDINKKLIEQSTGHEIKSEPSLRVGRRHLYGTPENPDICLQKRMYNGTPIIDAFGFGGAGVTLSWGVAIEVASIINKFFFQKPKIDIDSFQKFLYE